MMTEFTRTWCLLAVVAGCARSVAAKAPPEGSSALTLEVMPSLSGSRNATLRTGDEVTSGDGIQVAVKPTVDAHVYVAYCDRSRQLTIFPSDGGIEAKAGMIAYAPAGEAHIILDDQVGPEVLYVIASRKPLDVADPKLAAAISRIRPDASVECGDSFDRVLDKGKPVASNAGTPQHPEPGADQPPQSSAPPPAASQPAVPRPNTAQPRHASRIPPPAELQRGGFIRWGSMGVVSAGGDHDDIVVLRYGFTHVAPRSP